MPPTGGRFTATNVPLKLLMGLAWPLKIAGGPSWVFTDGYDITAKEPEHAVSDAEFSLMMQNLLKDRFGLMVYTETHAARVYVLTRAKNGLKLPDARPEPCFFYGSKTPLADGQERCGGMNVTPELIANEKVSMEWFTGVLESLLGRPVVNRTGFTGSFKVRLEFAAVAPNRDSDGTKPSIFAALERELGLKLVSQKGSEELLVIDHVERPSEN